MESQASPISETSSILQSRISKCPSVLCLDLIQREGRQCDEITILNDYMEAYFLNVYPLFPVLHKGAFLKLYAIYAPRATAERAREIGDASSPEGRAVCLISSVLALGALSLVQSREDLTPANRPTTKAWLPHYGEALGFYGLCIRLLCYTKDEIEIMLTYLHLVMIKASISTC